VRSIRFSPLKHPPVLSATRTPGTALTMEMLSESWICNARHSRLALDERGSCLRTSICVPTGTSGGGGSRGLISPSFPSCSLQIEPLSIYFAPSSCADILFCVCVIAAVDDRGVWNQNTPQRLSVDYYRFHAPLAIMTIARATFDGTPNSVLKPRPPSELRVKSDVHGLPPENVLTFSFLCDCFICLM